MIIDTHMHEKTYSLDSKLSLEDIVKRAREIGLDGVCITDHESNEIMEKAHEYSKETGFLIIVGAEILTHEGDITVFGLDRLPTEKLHAQQLIDMTLKAGGVAMSAHPFRKNNRGMGNLIRRVKGLSGIEAFNGSTRHSDNLDAYGLAAELNIPSLGASDAHTVDAIGRYATIFDGRIRDTRDFIDAVKSGRTHPAALVEGRFETIESYPSIINNKAAV
ncbi:MAG: PHP domain-containing protein [Peptoclostridium sp.]|uniref:PHP domain-containing protein n=1 Tax=Peptoclostridium sp. TaxID=1904860 RepID=UPI00139AF22A|nr:PHP domain-containing protein [Peptoclostridium sp.]MZQ75048.1 PHP domain-containing protein [Peptoclostridium sp.]